MAQQNNVSDLSNLVNNHEKHTRILYFMLLSKRCSSRLRVILNDRKEFHLNDCVWSYNGATAGPDTCHCHHIYETPEQFLERRIDQQPNYPLNPHSPTSSKKAPKPLSPGDEEDLDDFYAYRVCDVDNLCTWHEIYKLKLDALKFQLKVRNLMKESEIDAVYNSDSKEWHLTDCVRCVRSDSGPDVCHCRKAMMDPWQYLKGKYHYVDVGKFLKKFNEKQYPINYTK